MPQPHYLPAWASISIGGLIAGSVHAGTVVASGPAASYVTLPDEDGHDAVLALLAPRSIRLPIGVCVNEGPLPAHGATVHVGDGVIVTSERAWRPVRWWDPRPHVKGDALAAHASALIRVVREEPAGSFGLPLPLALEVAEALAGADADAAYGVLGLGPGLTPAGDDIVAGAFAVLATLGRLDDSVRGAVAAHARTRTTALSSALVAAAGRGEMIPQAARFLASVAAGVPPEQVSSAARALFAVGSTSGHDLAAGMAGALSAVSIKAAA